MQQGSQADSNSPHQDSKKGLRNILKLCLLVAISILLISCETVGYYSQAARGQLSLLLGREKIASLLVQPDLPDSLRHKLNLILEVRQFAEQELLLPAGGSYLTYVELDRQHVIWNVFAAPEFSVGPVNWCYPIAGCVGYRGYFSENAAEKFARNLEQQGFDVYTGGVDAYSTLGWFDDSILSTVINRSDHQLAGLLFHELAHQRIYLPGDTAFNESFASFVEQEGLRRWLKKQDQSDSLDRGQEDAVRQNQFVALVTDYRDQFADLYEQDLTEAEKRLAKSELQQALRREYEILKKSWDDYSGYDAWFSRSLNNAQLSTVTSYNDLVPAFSNLLDSHQGDLAAFFNAVEELSELSEEERSEKLSVL